MAPRPAPARSNSRAYLLASASFENLVALANDQERWHDARRMVWRDRGEPPVVLEGIPEIFEHAWKGGLRAGILAFGIRSGINMFLLLFKILRAPSSLRFALIRHAVLGSDSFRFAAMFGTFVSLYKFILNSLRFLPPLSHLRKKWLGAQSSPRFQPITPPSPVTPAYLEMGQIHLTEPHLTYSAFVAQWKISGKRWHATLAGSIAGLAILCETKARRVTIAQQMFVRGLQGSYNAWSEKHGFKVPHGDALVFGLCCAQIMYGFTMRPDTIPKSYHNWILDASRVRRDSLFANMGMVRDGTVSVKDIQQLVEWPNTTPANRTELLSLLERSASKCTPEQLAPCSVIHPWMDSCRTVQLDRWVDVFRWIAPVYAALHFIPMILFKRRELMRKPLHMLLRATKGTARSSAFLGTFVVIYQAFLCFKIQLYISRLSPFLPKPLREFLISKGSWWFAGLLTGFSLLVEAKHRRGELAMYVLPKGLEGAWGMMRGRGWVISVPYGESLLCALGMGMVMSTYQNDPQHLSGLVRRVLYQFIGPN
ncbi:hypothetical protein BOTBODRAFT_108502 [Botryobasidium botryosum FD-172 SS1]|uniref:Transmembrane protein 135 N-terminal domain-containing protein n=1 Tax=Botryobasidium botryosum (strain FD-172 SS1) TaxID=930990 RepID=A0A067MUG2_BOTB1|nr:hypothetical protein BOTBODRAFT_108502 [Botryobasidium botryosum FD-172 SS1]